MASTRQPWLSWAWAFFLAAITPQGSSINGIFTAPGYIPTGKLDQYSLVVTVVNTIIYRAVGTPWIMMVIK